MNPTAAIRTAIVLSLQVPEGTLPLDADLSYDPTDPYAVRLEIGTGEETVTWYFARDLLRDGTTRPVGDGDVRITPVTGTAQREIAVTLTTPEGHAALPHPPPPGRRVPHRRLHPRPHRHRDHRHRPRRRAHRPPRLTPRPRPRVGDSPA